MKSKYTFWQILNTFVLLVSKTLILKVAYFYMGRIGCTFNLTKQVSKKARRQIKIAMTFWWRNNTKLFAELPILGQLIVVGVCAYPCVLSSLKLLYLWPHNNIKCCIRVSCLCQQYCFHDESQVNWGMK